MQQMEEIVKIKAAVLSDMSRTSLQDARSTSLKLQSTAADKSRGVRQDMESKLIQSRSAAWNGAVHISDKANAVSKTASGGLGKAASGMRSLRSAMQKGMGRVPVSKNTVQA